MDSRPILLLLAGILVKFPTFRYFDPHLFSQDIYLFANKNIKSSYTSFKEKLTQTAGASFDRGTFRASIQSPRGILVRNTDISRCKFGSRAFLRRLPAYFPPPICQVCGVRDNISQANLPRGLWLAKVFQVISKRRVLGEDGKVEHVRKLSTTSLEAKAESKGLLDPKVSFLGGHGIAEDIKLCLPPHN